jgi:hypothetical protein
MSLSTARSSSRLFAAGLFALVLAIPAQADSVARSRNGCANRGGSFAASASDGCARVAGHVRVGALPAGNNQNAGPFAAIVAPLSYAADRDGVQPTSERSHVRAEPFTAFTELLPR